jgi:hypothetical protein
VHVARFVLAALLAACAEEASDAPPPPPAIVRPSVPPGQVLVRVVATSTPPGALVTGGGRELGTTPLETEVPIPAPIAGQPPQTFRFTFSLGGHSPASIDAAPLNGTITLAATLAPVAIAEAPVAIPQIAPAVVPARDGAPTNPFEAGQAWRGTYTCTQGRTDLVLRITGVSGDRVEAVFEFDYRGTTGSFVLSGNYDRSTRRLALRPGRWIRQPRGWMPVGMAGSVDASGRVYAGRITGADGCSTFRVTR